MVGNLRNSGLGNTTEIGTVPSYERLDLRLGWRPTASWEFSLVGQNLLDDRHPEFLSELGLATGQVQRSVYGKVTFRH